MSPRARAFAAYVALFIIFAAIAYYFVHHRLRRGLPTTQAPTAAPVSTGAFPYPPGLAPPRDADAAQRNGVYPADGGETCCFLGKTASVVLAKPPGDSTVIFWFYVPDVPPFASAPERITITFEGIAMRPVDVAKGMHDVSFALPPSLARKAAINAFIAMDVTYVPAAIGINTDPRTLSVVLTQVQYR